MKAVHEIYATVSESLSQDNGGLDETYQKAVRLGFRYVLGTMDAMTGLASSLVISLGDRLVHKLRLCSVTR